MKRLFLLVMLACLVLPEIDSHGASMVAETIRNNIAALAIEHCASATSNHVTISQGVATIVPKQQIDVSILVLTADKALYQAKKEGRNKVKSIFLQ